MREERQKEGKNEIRKRKSGREEIGKKRYVQKVRYFKTCMHN